jgi:hypothetical protein
MGHRSRGLQCPWRPFTGFDALVDLRRSEADRFYTVLQHNLPDPDARPVQRQALAGMIWNKQFYRFDVYRWLRGDPTMPPPTPERRQGRNADWRPRCRTNGNIPGSPPGISLSIASPSP